MRSQISTSYRVDIGKLILKGMERQRTQQSPHNPEGGAFPNKRLTPRIDDRGELGENETEPTAARKLPQHTRLACLHL